MPITIYRGSISVPRSKWGKVRFDFFVFPRGTRYFAADGSWHRQRQLLDGRHAIGYPWGWYSGEAKQIPKTHTLRVPIPEGARIADADQELIEQVRHLLVLRTCEACKQPTRYEIHFVTCMASDGFCGGEEGFTRDACLNHIPALVKRHGIKGGNFWRVEECNSESEYGTTQHKNLGCVTYDSKQKRFVFPAVVPEIRRFKPDCIHVSAGGDAPLFTYDSGELKIHNGLLYQIVMERLTNLKEGVKLGEIFSLSSLNLLPPLVRGLKVKSIKLELRDE